MGFKVLNRLTYRDLFFPFQIFSHAKSNVITDYDDLRKPILFKTSIFVSKIFTIPFIL